MAVAERTRVDELVRGSAQFLERVYRAQDALFPFATRLVGGGLVSDYSEPRTLRYTIGSFLGLQAVGHELAAERTKLLRLHERAIRWPGDLGLLTVLFADEPREAERLAARIDEAARTVPPERLAMPLQELAWMAWGACAAGDEALARRLYETIRARFVDSRTLLPRHSLRLSRRPAVSFGACVYYLRALWEVARLTGDEEPLRLFRAGVERLLAIQGPQGEWPWMIGVRSGLPVDVYPVYTVHQDSMAMLFLLPALELGMDVSGAIERSLDWVFGANELGEPMFVDDPVFFTYRSISRDESLRRERRYVRSTARALARRPAGLIGPERVSVFRECRSYHTGWVLYAWAS